LKSLSTRPKATDLLRGWYQASPALTKIMNITAFKNFFGIRTTVKIADQIILGVIPIFILFLIWVITTTGKNTTITLPEGVFEGYEKAAAPDGTFFSDRIRFSVEDCTLDYQEHDNVQKTWLIKDGQRYLISAIPARVFGKGVRLNLPPGKIMSRKKRQETAAKIEEKKLEKSEILPAEPVKDVKDIDQDEIEKTSEDFEASESSSQINPPESITDKPLDAPEPLSDYSSVAIPEIHPGTLPLEIMYRYEIVESRIFAPVILPSPGEVFRSLPALWSQRNLPLNILNSFLRVGAGFLVAFIIVFPISLLMGTFSKFKALFAPLMLFGGYLPIPALVPLTMSLFGTSEQQKVMFLALGFSIYLLPLFVKSLEEVDNVYLQTGYTLGARKYQVLNNILLPIALPGMFDAMRLGFGIGWGYIILAEMVDMGSHGVGTLILTSQRRGPREDIYLVLIAIVVMAFITDKIWEIVGKKLFPYRSQER